MNPCVQTTTPAARTAKTTAVLCARGDITHLQRSISMDANDLELLTDQIQDETGLDRRTAERIALTQLESPGQVTPPITAGMVKRALTAPPTPNEPVTIATVPTAHGCPD